MNSTETGSGAQRGSRAVVPTGHFLAGRWRKGAVIQGMQEASRSWKAPGHGFSPGAPRKEHSCAGTLISAQGDARGTSVTRALKPTDVCRPEPRPVWKPPPLHAADRGSPPPIQAAPITAVLSRPLQRQLTVTSPRSSSHCLAHSHLLPTGPTGCRFTCTWKRSSPASQLCPLGVPPETGSRGVFPAAGPPAAECR